jgi:activator of HSP90 ATPase
MSESLRLSTVLPVTPQKLYEAWLDSDAHAAFTGGGPARIDPRAGGDFTAWDGYISGKTLALDPFSRILQAWRTTYFPVDAPDSRLEILIEAEGEGSKLSLVHTEIPDGQGEDYRQGWEEYYFQPMTEYFTF